MENVGSPSFLRVINTDSLRAGGFVCLPFSPNSWNYTLQRQMAVIVFVCSEGQMYISKKLFKSPHPSVRMPHSVLWPFTNGRAGDDFKNLELSTLQ